MFPDGALGDAGPAQPAAFDPADDVPVDPYDELLGGDAEPPKKKKRRRQRAAPAEPPPYVDPLDPITPDEPIDYDAKPRSKRKSRRSAETDDGPLISDDDDPPPPRRRRSGNVELSGNINVSGVHLDGPIVSEGPVVGGSAAGAAEPASGKPRRSRKSRRRSRDEIDDEELFAAPEKKAGLFDIAAEQAARDRAGDAPLPDPAPKKKRFFGLFGGKKDDEVSYDLEPHMQRLADLTKVLRPESYQLDDIILVGSGREELRVSAHVGSGDGVDIIGRLIMLGFQSRSTDLHFEPGSAGADVRMRIDGALVELASLPAAAMKRAYGVVKVLCECDLGSRREVQEGSFSVVAPGKRSDYRVSFTPSVHGQKLAIRVLDLDNSPQSLRQLGAPKNMIRTLRGVMKQNAGMVLMCGPTGSGKTTTLYSLIRSIDVHTRNVMTLEDPVEYQIEGVTQIPIESDHGKGFAEMLPAMLRQDPDVLLIGEIRDGISAKIAMQAVMTGHLVLSTVHAPDTLATVYRLLDLNADANMVASALDLILSQRLIRVLCDECKIRRKPTAQEAQSLGRHARDAVYDPGSCRRCLGTGFSGRRAIFELLNVREQLGDAVFQAKTLDQLRRAVDRNTFVTLRQNGHQLVAGGVTSFDEINRVIGIQ